MRNDQAKRLVVGNVLQVRRDENARRSPPRTQHHVPFDRKLFNSKRPGRCVEFQPCLQVSTYFLITSMLLGVIPFDPSRVLSYYPDYGAS